MIEGTSRVLEEYFLRIRKENPLYSRNSQSVINSCAFLINVFGEQNVKDEFNLIGKIPPVSEQKSQIDANSNDGMTINNKRRP